MAKLSFTFLLLMTLLGFASARFIPRGTQPEGALKKRANPLERVAMVSSNPRYFLGLFKRADEESCPIMYQQCSDDAAACCKVGETCGTWDDTPGCCPTDAVCQGGIATRTTISIVQVATLTGSKISLPTIQFGGFSLHISGIFTLNVPDVSVNLPTIVAGGGESTSIQKVILEGPHARVTGDYTDNNATATPEITGSWTEVYASLTATDEESGTATETGTGTETETVTETGTETETITNAPVATVTGTGTGTGTETVTATTAADSAAAAVGVKADYYYAAMAMLAVLLGFAVVA